MFLKICLPKNPSLRFRINTDKKLLFLKKFKKLFFKKKNNSGRNNYGKITVRHKGSGLFNFRRIIDIYRVYNNKNNYFFSYDIDKKYSCFLGLIKYDNGCINYILAPHNLNLNSNVEVSFLSPEKKIGTTMPLGWIKNGLNIFNIEPTPSNGGRIARSAGTFGTVILHTNSQVLIKLPSKKLKFFSKYCFATLGRASNILHFLKNFGKAGINRYYNNRPTVRGETMNPIDHPNGGRTRGGKPRKNPWGKIIK